MLWINCEKCGRDYGCSSGCSKSILEERLCASCRKKKPKPKPKPCLFCKEKKEISPCRYCGDYWKVDCLICGASGPKCKTETEAIERWNRE